ncbi:hypothetical protein M0L39_RS02390 [Providencia rettgeri]|nr:hypothetical protein [Providencia rettgeri]EJD6598799.1 hypothetical protein [Providencia rettgeri]
MTVSTEISSNEYTGNGVTTDFDYKFRIFKANQLSVITSDADGDNVVTLRLGTDYTVTGANKSAGGKVILTKPLANGYKISIARDIPIKQEASFRNQSKFFAETHEDAFDYLTMIIQRIWGSLGSLYLKRPNILSNWFDAKGYRIANLGKPKRNSDAVDLGTLRDEVEGVNSTILAKEKRTLRVDDMDISAFPISSERKNKQIGFDSSGFPTLLDPVDTGSLGYQLVDSFEKGAELTGRFQALFWESKQEYFRWDGKLPKNVPPNSTPIETGGIKTEDNPNGLWVSVIDLGLRNELLSPVGGKSVYINSRQSLDDYASDMPSFERWGDVDALDNTAALYTALAWMKTRGVGHLYFPRKYRFAETIPFETNIAYNGNGKSTSGFIITHNEDALKVISGVKYSPEVNNLIIQHESLNSPSAGICGINGNQMRLSNVQVNGFKTGVVTGGSSYYSNFDRVRAMNCDVGYVFNSGSRGITASDCSADAKVNGFVFDAETDSINNINLINPKAEKIETNGVGFLFKAANGKIITGVSAVSGRFAPKSTENGQVFIKTESENAADISNIMFIEPTVFNTPTANMLVGNNVFEQVTILGTTLGFGNMKATGMFIHDVENLIRAARLRYIHSDTRPRLEIRNRENSLPVGIRASNVEAMGVLNVNNQGSGREAGIAIAECTWEKPFKMGPLYLWVTSTGLVRRKLGVPVSEGDGVPCNW